MLYRTSIRICIPFVHCLHQTWSRKWLHASFMNATRYSFLRPFSHVWKESCHIGWKHSIIKNIWLIIETVSSFHEKAFIEVSGSIKSKQGRKYCQWLLEGKISGHVSRSIFAFFESVHLWWYLPASTGGVRKRIFVWFNYLLVHHLLGWVSPFYTF